MNIFILDWDLKKCAEYHLDKHVTKLCIEYAQLLCSAHWMCGNEAPYKLTHKNHPCSIWTRNCIENYIWLCDLGLEVCKEYTYRYDKVHKSQAIIEWCAVNKPKLRYNGDITEHPLAMPIECKIGDAVESYRNYYVTHKVSFAKWKKREKPQWFL
jgi:hypothetical protein